MENGEEITELYQLSHAKTPTLPTHNRGKKTNVKPLR